MHTHSLALYVINHSSNRTTSTDIKNNTHLQNSGRVENVWLKAQNMGLIRGLT